jgi:hypothetical protein
MSFVSSMILRSLPERANCRPPLQFQALMTIDLLGDEKRGEFLDVEDEQ